MNRLLAAACGLLVCAWAADAPKFVYWSASELKGYEQKLGPKISSQKSASQPLGDFGNHLAMIAHRQGDGEAEVHELMTDYFVVQSGEATLVHGGGLVSGKTTAPNELRGPSIRGGRKQALKAGDAVHIPAGMPHQLLIAPGKQFTYFVIKVKR